jgi:hypothetical protein
VHSFSVIKTNAHLAMLLIQSGVGIKSIQPCCPSKAINPNENAVKANRHLLLTHIAIVGIWVRTLAAQHPASAGVQDLQMWPNAKEV